MFRRSVVIAGIGVVVLGVVATALAAIGSAGSSVATSRQSPPVPRVSTLGGTRLATLVSYCWSYQRRDGTQVGSCADGVPGRPAHTLRWRSGVEIVLDLRLPAHAVQVQAVRITRRGRPRQVVEPHLTAADRSGRKWLFGLPRRAARDTDLLISARFAQGDAESDLGIRRIARS